ncbi:hypothetical protein LTR66_006018 [Elasticomyces elasticus]|nr:hypothetical protein LTR50_005913 [Elasticomyces elasticus]KAK4993383.1 hypothetical protein LTR66_006018 [Elasticomyces elasticus]
MAQPMPVPPNETKGPTLLLLSCILTSFSIVTTILRCWVRRVRYTLGWDDYTIALTTTLAVARTIVQIVGVRAGNGRHRAYLSVPAYQYVNFLGWLTQLILFPTIGLLKTSICLLILRIKSTKHLRWFLSGIILGLFLTNGLCFLVLLAECSPVKAYWVPGSGHCWNPKIRIYSIYLQVGTLLRSYRFDLLPAAHSGGVEDPDSAATEVRDLRLDEFGLNSDGLRRYKSIESGGHIASLRYGQKLHLGIIAANMALARPIFTYLTQGAHSLTAHSKSRSTYSRGSRPGYGNTPRSGYAGSEEPGLQLDPTYKKRASTHSQNSTVALEPGVDRKTDLSVVESSNASEAEQGRGSSGKIRGTEGIRREMP